MSKLKHIIAREYITRIRKKTFIVMTILGPVLFAALMVVPVWVASLEDQEEKTIVVAEFDAYGAPVPDSLMRLTHFIKNKPLLKFEFPGDLTVPQAEALVKEGAYYGALVVRHNVITSGSNVEVELLANKQPSLGIELHISNSIEQYLHDSKLLAYHVPVEVLKSSRTQVSVITKLFDEGGFKNQGDQNIRRAVGYAGGFLIYMFIFFFGAQVMRGVVEEKTSRIIEVVVTSVRPFQLMMGKIIGIGMVGLTQFFAWLILTFVFATGTQYVLLNKTYDKVQQQEQSAQAVDLFQSQNNQLMAAQDNLPTEDMDLDVNVLMEKLEQVNFPLIIGVFIFYFLGGFLLYASMFAAIGAAVDSETDTQQFMLPVTIPLIVSIVVMANAITNPEGQVAYWFSIIPFTSPIVMMARIGFKVPVADLILSGSLLILTFIGMTWLSGRVYRTGILMYGKKVSYKELWKWLRY